MSPLCAGGSEPKSGAPTFFNYDASDIASFLPPFAGAIAVELLGLSTAPQNTADFCSTDPPTDMPNAGDWLLFAAPPLAWPAGTYERFGNWVRASKWRELCQCKAVSGFSCTASDWAPDPSPNEWGFVTITPGTTEVMVAGGHGGNVQSAVYSTTHDTSGIIWEYLSWSTTAPDIHIGVTYDAAKPYVGIRVNTFRPSEVLICGVYDTPTTPALPDLPPAPTGFTLPAVPSDCCGETYKLVQALETQVQWIAAQLTPISYAPGPVHTGLHDLTEIDVTQLAGVVVEVTEHPIWMAIDPTSPPSTWRYGWIRLGTPDGWMAATPITTSPQVALQVPANITRVGLTFETGVVATLRELQRPK